MEYEVEAGEDPFVPQIIRQIALGIGKTIIKNGGNTILIGRDPRESSTWIEAAIIEGLRPLQIQVWLAGMVPTSAISCAMPQVSADLGIMITASTILGMTMGSNALEKDGKRFPISFNTQITDAMPNTRSRNISNSKSNARHRSLSNIKREEVLEIWESYMPILQLDGLTILLDAANGASSNETPPDYKNIWAPK